MNRNFFKKSILLSAALSITFIGSNPKSILSFGSDNNTISKENKKAFSTSEILYTAYLNNIYETANLYASGLSADVFYKAVTGFYNLKKTAHVRDDQSIITIVDFNQPSHTKRMWIIDLEKASLVLNTWVAHGQGSGMDVANQFSNTDSSHQSSLGFYLTGEIYMGKHGRSLRLDGMDAQFNSNARQRDIVVHGADYVSQQMINSTGRLGRSFGCPAVAPELTATIIELIKDKTVLYINGPETNHFTSKYLDQDLVANAMFPAVNNNNQLQAML